jgi:hypothetical protein
LKPANVFFTQADKAAIPTFNNLTAIVITLKINTILPRTNISGKSETFQRNEKAATTGPKALNNAFKALNKDLNKSTTPLNPLATPDAKEAVPFSESLNPLIRSEITATKPSTSKIIAPIGFAFIATLRAV